MALRALVPAFLLSAPHATGNILPHRIQAILRPDAAAQEPMITPAPASSNWEPTKTLDRRGIVDDLTKDVGSVLGGLGSGIPSYVASGIPNFFQDFPSGDKVVSSLGLNDDDVKALPTQVLNIPGYGNWTDQGWNLRFHGNVYKQPNISQDKLNDLANVFLIDTSVEQLPPPQASQARNLTSEIFVIQQSDQNVTFDIAPAPTAGASGEKGGGGAVTPKGGNQTIKFPTPTTPEGDYDGFVQIKDEGLQAGNATQEIQRMDVYTQGDVYGNATAYLVPEDGFTVVSDIDDILRVTRIYQPKDGLLNSFARPFTPWMNMPNIYSNWSQSLDNIHFHYLTTTPEQITRNYMDFIYKTYPGGSFDTRPLNFSDISATLSIRKFLLDKIFQTYPKRKFILVADTSNSDVMKDYPACAKQYPGQVQCIFLRNTTNTDSGDKFPYDTSGFEGLDNKTYMFFNVPDDLRGLNIAAGQCVNSTIQQHVTFSTQGLPFGLSKKGAASRAGGAGSIAGVLGAGLLAVTMGLLLHV